MTLECDACQTHCEDGASICPACGHDTLLEVEDDRDDRFRSFVWACPECDREHVKNSPPCSRCGNSMLERREQRFEDVEKDLPSASYVSALKPYLPIIALFAVVIGLAGTGVVTPAMIPVIGAPSLPDAPGESDVASGIDLEAVEREVHDRFDAEREARGADDRSYDSNLAHLAAYMNRNQVREAHGLEPYDEPDAGDFFLSCSRTIDVLPFVLVGDAPIEWFEGESTRAGNATIDHYEDESALAADIEDRLRSSSRVESHVFSADSKEALDVHVGEDGFVYGYYAIC